jgi:hypothetical protein
MENYERMEKYCTLIVALENGEFDRQRIDSDCSSIGDRYTGSTSTESCKFPFSLTSSYEAKTSFSPTMIPKALGPHTPSLSSTAKDGTSPEDKHQSFTRRKTAVLATDTASFLLNTKKSRLHSIVAPNSFEHQYLANSSSQDEEEEKKSVRRMVPRQTSLAKIWDTVDSDEEETEAEEIVIKNTTTTPMHTATTTMTSINSKDEKRRKSSLKEMKPNDDARELEEEDEAFRRSIALCQEVSLRSSSPLPIPSLTAKSQLETEPDNDEEEDEIRALRIEEAIMNKLHPQQQQRRHRKESFVRYVDRMWSPSTPHNNNHNPPNTFDFDPNTIPREKSFSVFSTELDGPSSGSIDNELFDHRTRAVSAGSGITNWLASRGKSMEKTKKKPVDDPDLEMGAFGREIDSHSKEPLSYLSDCLYSQDHERQSLVCLSSYLFVPSQTSHHPLCLPLQLVSKPKT